MATVIKNLSDHGKTDVPSAEKMRFAIVTSQWNTEITSSMQRDAIATLIRCGALKKNIKNYAVPGSFELSFGAQLAAALPQTDAVICIGCVIRGETKHFDFICDAVAKGITDVSLKFNKPVIFGVLTTETLQQAKDRSGGMYGNKGDEAAIAAIKMIAMQKKIS